MNFIYKSILTTLVLAYINSAYIAGSFNMADLDSNYKIGLSYSYGIVWGVIVVCFSLLKNSDS